MKTTKKMTVSEKRVLKYFNALKRMNKQIENREYFHMSQFIAENGLSSNTIKVLRGGKLVKYNGNPRTGYWSWETIKPTREMAIKVLDKLTEMGREDRAKYVLGKDKKPKVKKEEVKKKENRGGKRVGSGRKKKVDVKPTIKTVKPTVKKTTAKKETLDLLDSYTIKFFFGLIKIEVKLNYKQKNK